MAKNSFIDVGIWNFFLSWKICEIRIFVPLQYHHERYHLYI